MKKTILKTVAAAIMVSTAFVFGAVPTFADTIASNDATVLSGNYDTATKISASAENCTVTVNADSAKYEYSSFGSLGTRTGLIITDLDTSNGKFTKATSKVTFTTDGAFNILLGDESISKDVSGLVLKKSDGTDVELTVLTAKNRSASAENVPAGTYSITAKNTSTYLPCMTITVTATEKKEFKNGTITLVNDSSKGNVELSDENGEAIVVNGNKTGEVTGGTNVTVKVTPEAEYYVSSITLGDEALNVTDGSTSFVVDGDAVVTVSYEKLGKLLTINDDLSFVAGKNDDMVKEYNVDKSTDYYFELTVDAKLNSSNKRIETGSGNENNKSVLLNVGEKEELQAFVTVEYKSSSSSSTRYAKVGNVSKLVKDTVGSSSANRIYTVPVDAGNVLITSNSGNIYIYSIKVSFGTAGTLTAVGTDYYTVDGTNLYIIHKVNDTELDAASLYLIGSDGESAVSGTETDVVYEAVEFADGTKLTSTDDFGGSKIYVVKVKDASSDNVKSTTSFKWGTTTASE